MTDRPQAPDPACARDAKLRAIATVFGEAVASRIGTAAVTQKPAAPDADRLAWQTNRLIRQLRDRVDLGPDTPRPVTRSAATPAANTANDIRQGQSRLPMLVAGEDLAAEHPAVIAHLLKGETQQVRVSVLRALPGQVARAVMRRLRTG